MSFDGYGYRAWGETEAALDESLHRIAEAGYSHAEIAGDNGWDLLVDGCVNGRQLARFVSVVDRHRERLRFVVHGPGVADLFDLGHAELHERLLRGGLEIARAVGSATMIVHPGQRRPYPAGSERILGDLQAREREIVGALADEAAGWGGGLALETWLPPAGNGKWGYSYAVWPEQLAAQVEAIGRPNVGVCLDSGHLWASSRWYGFDFLGGATRLAPLVVHLHLQDVASGAPLTGNAIGETALGLGDLHLPPGWGAIPFADLLAIDLPRRPCLMTELLEPRYRALLPEVLADLQAWSAAAS